MARSLSLSKGREGVSENRRGAHWAPVLQGDTMRIVFMGTPDLSRTVLEALLAAGHEIVLAITQPDREKGRGKALQMSPVKDLALERGIPVYQPEKIRREESISWLEAFFQEEPADIGVVAAFGQILPQRVLDMPRLGCLNVHTSLLPKYRGAAPIQQAILAGEKETGVTIMQMDAGLDTGDILLQRSLPIEERETGGSLTEKLAALGGELLCDALLRLEEGQLIPVPQMGGGSYAGQADDSEKRPAAAGGKAKGGKTRLRAAGGAGLPGGGLRPGGAPAGAPKARRKKGNGGGGLFKRLRLVCRGQHGGKP